MKNIYWILGGLPKKNDQFNLKGINRRVKKAYIIGKHQNHFKKQLKNFRYECFPNLYNASKKIFIDLKEEKNYCNVLLSPASASYDQYKNFTQRGEHFKKIIKNVKYIQFFKFKKLLEKYRQKNSILFFHALIVRFILLLYINIFYCRRKT